MDDRKNKIIVGSVIALVVLIIMIFIVLKSTQATCDLVDSRPKYDLFKLPPQNISSSDYRVLLNFAGFLTYKLDNSTSNNEKIKQFMPLNVQSISLEANGQQQILILNADCAKLTMTLNKDPKQNMLINNINVDLKLANGDNKSCTSTVSIVTPQGKHYYCRQERTYSCASTKKADGMKEVKTIADLVLSGLEFEIDGNIDKFKKGMYDRPEAICL